ncbi:threonine synthase [Pelagibaculum spongiae]|uniref:Pyridoxal-5'-phosphate-dependent protein subunit beta n=1 Tax=Pelagibaculum spongiae TaxID=2080658 RepID=A0A2V1H1A1_9GAMM|nr:pyridoxal-phosphate dependent enzyme [Pelagibaculum spongiae]PVZ71740.1 pyridoxal-5'-phosphate-dependent protein subunit beta [Pelagibaculum spongiae]
MAQYRCNECHTHYPISTDLMLCPACKSKQKVNEPLRGVLEVDFSVKGKSDLSGTSLSDIRDWLPVSKQSFAPIPVGNTPMWSPTRLSESLGLNNLFIKDDGANPTSSFKDRASWMVSAFAKENGINEIVLASTGNAGSSMAGIAAASGQKVTLFLPKAAPAAKMIQAQQYGANLILVDGNYDRACELALDYSNKFGGMNRNTAFNPMTIEGKKTVSIEMVRQLEKAPDHVFVATGDGCIAGGVYKGFRDLIEAGVIDEMPIIWVVQSSNSDALCIAMEKGHFEKISATTIADSISVDVPANGYQLLGYLKQYDGRCIRVADDAILKAQKYLSESSGLFSEPAGATAFAGLLAVKDQLPADSTVVVLATGNGLKDAATAAKGNPLLPEPIGSINELLVSEA